MDFSNRLALSYYKTITVLNEDRQVFLVQHVETQKIFVKKILSVYNQQIYQQLQDTPVIGIPKTIAICEEDHTLTIIEEYISGQTLEEKIKSDTLSQADVLSYMIRLCQILKNLHGLAPAIIHRDIKPSNILITPQNELVLIDFNAAKNFSGQQSQDTVLLGTKGYAAPEQYGFGASTQQTDIYALGILLKELSLNLNTHSFDAIIEKATQLNPADRFTSISEILNLLTEINLACHPTKDTQEGSRLIPPGFRRRSPWRMVVSSLIYFWLAWFCLTLDFTAVTGLALWIERFFCLFMFLSLIFVGCNYMNMQKFMPLCQHKNRFIRILGILLLDTISLSILFTVMMVLVLITDG
jgi:serine/threonine protein kinase